MAQFELLQWVADGCKDGVYEGTAYRVSARALHNRGVLRVTGSGKTWTAQVTPDGARRLEEEAKRIEAERERARKEAEAKAERERQQQQLRDQAAELLRDVLAAGGRLDLGPKADPQDVLRMRDSLNRSGFLPEGQRLTHEPTRMDPVLGVTVYLEPDFDALTEPRSFTVPRQLRNPHPAVVAFQNKKALVSKSQIGRAARFLQALVLAASEVGWKVPSNVPHASRGQGESGPDLALRLPSRELVVTIRELDQQGRRVQPYVTDRDYYTRTERTIANKRFQATGRLEVMVAKVWEDHQVLALRDTNGAPLEDQLPVLIRKLEVAEAEAAWSRQEESRRSEIRKARWEEVKQEAFTRLAYERNAEQLRVQLERRRAAAEMRVYADEVEAHSAAQRHGPDAAEARTWASWIREHADRTDPITGPLHPLRVASASHDDLAPHMDGWSTYGPYR